jgi:hypothetical protein
LFRQENSGDDQVNDKKAIACDNQTKRSGRYALKGEPGENAYRCRYVKPRMMRGVFSKRIQDRCSVD